jgi:hypothetical protein
MFMSKLENNVAQENAFFLQNGKVLNSVRELYDEIHKMPESVFFHHVTSERNDFSNWVKEVIGDKTLAGKIAKAGTPIVLKETLAAAFEKPAATATKKPEAAKATTTPKAAKTTKTEEKPAAKSRKK